MKRLLLGMTALLCSVPILAGANSGVTYLALGDSITFGYSPLLPLPFPPTHIPVSEYVGYPEVIAKYFAPLNNLANLACPGQTSASFLDPKAVEPRQNCYDWRSGGGGLPFPLPLHTNYALPTSQMMAAMSELSSNHNIGLVTIMIGGNDLIVLQEKCQNPDPLAFKKCITDGAPAVIQAYALNLGTILSQLRTAYKGTIVLVTYYSTDYRDPLTTGAIAALNDAAQTVANLFDVEIADGFGAFLLAAASKGGDTCGAGLLIKLPTGGCDVHPTEKGRNILAVTTFLALFQD